MQILSLGPLDYHNTVSSSTLLGNYQIKYKVNIKSVYWVTKRVCILFIRLASSYVLFLDMGSPRLTGLTRSSSEPESGYLQCPFAGPAGFGPDPARGTSTRRSDISG